MRSIPSLRIAFAMVTALVGVILVFFALIRLGFGRHGSDPGRAEWLHLAWLCHPGEHRAHAENMLELSVGILAIVIASITVVTVVAAFRTRAN